MVIRLLSCVSRRKSRQRSPGAWVRKNSYRAAAANERAVPTEPVKHLGMEGFDAVGAVVVRAVNQLITEKDEVLANATIMMKTECITKEQEIEQKNLGSEPEILTEMIREAIGENARVAQNQNEYETRYAELPGRYEEKKARYEQLETEIADKKVRTKQFENFIITLDSMDGVCREFDGGMWASLLECVTVYARDDIRFTFRGGMTIRV
ncbi:MAG: hypothetical protein LUF34_04070 [Lachnospiraceae bacterium]|nr:hypothetical protein [Lachnospiraceae bacterium]